MAQSSGGRAPSARPPATPLVGHTAVSPWNCDGVPVDSLRANTPRIADCTLRDGEQQAGVVFSKAQKVEIAQALAAAGVHDLELGTPAVSREDAEAIREVVALDLGVMTSALGRALPADVDLVTTCGVDAVRLSMPISERQRDAKLKLGPDEYVERAAAICIYAKEKGLQVIFSPYDTTRADEDLLSALLGRLSSEGCADRVRLVDTTGAAGPEAIRRLVRFMREAGDIPVEVHCHDDFGLATANTVAGALAGAEWLSTTVNGIGERSGNAALEEVVTALAVLYGIETGVSLAALTDLSRLVEAHSGIYLQSHKPVVGRNSFSHESGLVVAGILRDPFTAEAYAPEIVGQTRHIVVGKKSGRASVEAKLRLLYPYEVPSVDLDGLVESIKTTASALGRALEDDEVRELVSAVNEG